MRVGFPGGPRLEWYDRNPIAKPFSYGVYNIAPHAATVRWTYTVPTGKKAWLDSCYAFARRATAATTAGEVICHVALTIDATVVSLNRAVLKDNTVNKDMTIQLNSFGVLLAGNSIAGRTFDDSTGGTCDYTLCAKVTEFDA